MHDDPDCAHFSTARDVAELTDFAFGNSLFEDIVSRVLWDTTTCEDSSSNSRDTPQKNTNSIIQNITGVSSGSRYRGAYGVKTGTTGNAKQCLVSAARRCGVDLIAVVLGSDGARYTDTHPILDVGFSRAIDVPESLGLPFVESFETDGVGCRFFVPGIDDAPVDIDNGS